MKTFLSPALVAAIIISGVLAPQQKAHAATITIYEFCSLGVTSKIIPSPVPTLYCLSRYFDAAGEWISHEVTLYAISPPGNSLTLGWGPGQVWGSASWAIGLRCNEVWNSTLAIGGITELWGPGTGQGWELVDSALDSAWGTVGYNGPCP